MLRHFYVGEIHWDKSRGSSGDSESVGKESSVDEGAEGGEFSEGDWSGEFDKIRPGRG